MRMTTCRRLAAVLGVLCFSSGIVARAADGSAVVPGARVAVIGDSITEQKLYSKYLEAYLLACSGVPDVKVFQYGWSGETAGGFASRVENDLRSFQPTVATLCYGMNDGGYQPWKETIGQSYEANMRNVLKKLDAIGVKSIVVGSPGAVDTDFFRPGQMMGDLPAHAAYNDNLAHLRDIDQKLASEGKQRFANVHDAMVEAMKKAKQGLGKEYDVCGRDGFHPGPNGQLVMAYAFLKGLGVNGDIGAITVDLAGDAQATDGHKVLNGKGGVVELESKRWPFCFEGDAKSSGGTRSITPFLPFNQELNRLTLKVTGLKSGKAVVKWGDVSKEFSKEQLAAGVNLTEEFAQTPFDAAFQKFQTAVAIKQNFETYMIKQVVTNFRSIPQELKSDEELTAALQRVGDRLQKHQQKLDADVRALLVPVKHTIRITAE